MSVRANAPEADEQNGNVVDLEVAREHRRFLKYRERAERVLAENRSALQRLFDSGVVFTRHGSRVARDLLQAHQNLMRAVDISSRETELEEGDIESPETLFQEIEALLEKASVICQRNSSLFQSSSSPVF
jgi:hypothetical protein